MFNLNHMTRPKSDRCYLASPDDSSLWFLLKTRDGQCVSFSRFLYNLWLRPDLMKHLYTPCRSLHDMKAEAREWGEKMRQCSELCEELGYEMVEANNG